MRVGPTGKGMKLTLLDLVHYIIVVGLNQITYLGLINNFL